MNRFVTFFILILVIGTLCPAALDASITKGEPAVLKLRAAHHSGYIRIVIEGPGNVLSEGKIERDNKNIVVDFKNTPIELSKVSLPFNYSKKNSSLRFAMSKIGKYKHFMLKNPDRIVIDVYEKDRKKRAASKAKKPVKKKVADKTLSKAPALEPVKQQKKAEPKVEEQKTEEPEPEVEDYWDTPGMDQYTAKPKVTEEKDDYHYVSDEYNMIKMFIKEGKSFAALKELKLIEPESPDSVANYHYLFAEAYMNLEQYAKANSHYMQAFIYTSNDKIREHSLYKRALSYQKARLYHEAKAYYARFIKEYPASKFTEKAHLHIAGVMTEMGIFVEAAEHFGKVGERSDAMFGMAKALHSLDMIDEATLVFDDALLMDKNYPERFPEAYYYMGENMRKAGKLKDAKKYLLMVQYGPFKPKAGISLGLIALEERDLKSAESKFKSATRLRDRVLQSAALFYLAKTHVKQDRIGDAIRDLEELRLNHFDSAFYKEGILELSRLLRKDGREKEAVSLIKELVYTKEPPREVYSDIEEVILDSIGKQVDEKKGMKLVELWKELGMWVTEKTREKFLLKVARGLRHEGEPFLTLTSWLVKNASRHIRVQAASDLADYYVDTGDVQQAKMYMEVADEAFVTRDRSVRVEVKIKIADLKPASALKRIQRIKKHDLNDLKLIARIIAVFQQTKPERAMDAVSYYEKVLKSVKGDAEAYIRIADILYDMDRKAKAFTYYKTAAKKDPDNQWASYRIGQGSGKDQSREIYGRLKDGNNFLNRIAKSKLLEMDLVNKIQEVY